MSFFCPTAPTLEDAEFYRSRDITDLRSDLIGLRGVLARMDESIRYFREDETQRRWVAIGCSRRDGLIAHIQLVKSVIAAKYAAYEAARRAEADARRAEAEARRAEADAETKAKEQRRAEQLQREEANRQRKLAAKQEKKPAAPAKRKKPAANHEQQAEIAERARALAKIRIAAERTIQ